jgi:hypothetical protein
VNRPTYPISKERPALCVLVILLAMVLRVVYVPAHLAHEEHVGSVEYLLHHGAASETHAHHDQDGDHDHEEEHPPHTVFDHASELVVQRAPAWRGASTFLAWAWTAPAQLTPLLESRAAAQTNQRACEPRPRSPQQSRGPPAAA